MKKSLILLLMCVPLWLNAQTIVNPITGEIDYTGNIDNAFVTAGVAYFIVDGDTVASDTLIGTVAMNGAIEDNAVDIAAQLDSIAAHWAEITLLRADIATLESTDSSYVAITFTPVASIASPVEGMVYYDSDVDSLYLYDGTGWQALNGGGSGGSTTMTDFSATAWRLFYSNGSGDVTELTPGADGTVLTSTGVSAAPAFESVAGTGDLLSTNNLSDVADPATALANLGGIPEDSSQKIVWDPTYINRTESVTGDSLNIDLNVQRTTMTNTGDSIPSSAAVAAYVAANGGEATLDSLDLEFNSEVYPLFNFHTGQKNDRDTLDFETSSILGSYFNRGRDTLVITSIVASIGGDGNDTLQVQLAYNDTLANFSTDMVVVMEGSPMSLTTDASGYGPFNEYTEIVNDTIPPDVWVWPHVASVQIGEKPTLFGMTVSGYKIKGTYNDSLWLVEEEPAGDGYETTLIADDSTKIFLIAEVANITASGGLVSQWNDISGYNNHVTQANNLIQPSFDTDSVTFSSTRDDELRLSSFVQRQPYTVYAVMNAHTWTASNTFFQVGEAGGAGNTLLRQDLATPRIALSSELALNSASGQPPLNEWFIVTVVVNGNNSELQINNNIEVGGPLGTRITEFLWLGNDAASADFSMKEFIIRGGADDDTYKTNLRDSLNVKYTIF